MTCKQWFIALRPWSFTASVIPISFGAAFAAYNGSFNFLLFMLALLGGVALHAGTNLFNTYGDYMSGVDTVHSAKTCPQLVTGQASAKSVYRAAWLMYGLAGLAGVTVIYFSGWWLLIFAVAGAAGGYYYTNGKKPYKYSGMGPFFVFFLMGPLLVLPSYIIQTGHFSWEPVLGSLGIACLVTALMHSNDIRDIIDDRTAGINTLAMRIGRRMAVNLYIVLNLCAFVFTGVLVAAGILPFMCMACFVLLPALIMKMRQVAATDFDFDAMRQEQWAAGFHMRFGGILTLSIALAGAMA